MFFYSIEIASDGHSSTQVSQSTRDRRQLCFAVFHGDGGSRADDLCRFHSRHFSISTTAGNFFLRMYILFNWSKINLVFYNEIRSACHIPGHPAWRRCADLSRQPSGRPDGTLREYRPVVGAVGDLDALKVSCEEDRADRRRCRHPDHARRSRSSVPPHRHDRRPSRAPEFLVQDLKDSLCGAARGILLVAVVGFRDLDIVVAEARAASRTSFQKMLTPTEVARYHRGNVPRQHS